MNSGSGDVYDLEFRCADDGAWYTVRAILNGETLTVKHQNFPRESYNAGDFTTIEAVDEFCQRFRPLSEQLQDSECYRVAEGMRVCAGDLRFFDAIVDAISKLEEALYNMQFEQHWLEAQTERQAIVNEGLSMRAIHKAIFESAALIGASVLQVYLLQRLFE